MRALLLRAYRETCYSAGGVDIRVGRRSAGMDALLLSRGVRQAALITAYNPFSRRMPPGWNRRMQGKLAAALRRWPSLPGHGAWRQWSEAHLLVLGDSRLTWRLVRRFRQHGIVTLRIRQPARLLMISRPG